MRTCSLQTRCGSDLKIGPYTQRSAESPQWGCQFQVPSGMQRPIGAALDLKNPGFSGGCQARWPSWQDRQVPRWFVSKDSRCEASWLSRNTAATQHLHRTVVWTSHVLSAARIPCPIGSSVCCVEKHSYLMGASEFPHSMVLSSLSAWLGW